MDDPSTCGRHPAMADYRNVLAANVRAARKGLGLSQEELAHGAGIDRTYISGIERGKRNPSLDLIVKVAGALNVSPAVLLTPSGVTLQLQKDSA